MIQRKKYTLLWFSAGLLLSLLALLVVFEGLSGNVLITDPEGIPETADAVLNCVRAGDWTTLETLVAGNAVPAPVTGENGSPEQAIWNTYRESLSWDCEESYGVQGSHVTQRVTVTCLDIAGVTDCMARLLSGSGENPAALLSAARQVLENDPPMMQREITLTFLRRGSHWQLVPNNALLALVSGFTAS